MKPDLRDYLRSLDFTRPVVDLIDEVTDWLQENRSHLGYEESAEMADRLVVRRLK